MGGERAVAGVAPRYPAVIYAAKSTEDKRGSIPTQLADARAMCERESWLVMGEEHDEAFSAYSRNRGPGLERAQGRAAELAVEHGACALVAQHSDRFARGGGNSPGAAQHLGEIMFWAMRHNVQLRSVQDDSNLTNPLLAFIMGERNYEDSRRKSEATRSGKRRAAERGNRNGGPRPFGYLQRSGELVPVAAEFEALRRMRDEYVIEGRSLSNIARALNADAIRTVRGASWSQRRVSQMFANLLYVGKVKNRDQWFDGRHTPVWTWAEWDELQLALDAKRGTNGGGRGRPASGSHLLTGGLLRCGFCGSPVVPRTTKNSQGRVYELYSCNGRLQGLTDCAVPSAQRERVDAAVLAYFEGVGLDFEATRCHFADQAARQVTETLALLQQAEREEAVAADRLVRVRRAFQDGELPTADWREQREQLLEEQKGAAARADRLRSRVSELEAEADTLDAEEDALRYLAELRAAVAGEVAGARSLDAVRAALLRLFHGFTLHTCGHDADEPPALPEGWTQSRPYTHSDLRVIGGWIVEPHARTTAILDLDKEVPFPLLASTGVFAAETNVASRR